MKKTLLSMGLLAGLASTAFAVPFNNGTADSVATVGPNVGDDYATLSAASVAFNAVVGGINANWNIEITGNISDPGYCYFGNTIASGKKVTIKPAANATPTVTFTATTGGGTTAGFLVIGINTNGVVGTANRFPSSYQWVIDGSNNGTDSRDLTFTNTGAASPNLPGTTAILRPASDTDGLIVKNTRLISIKASGTDNVINIANGKIGTFNDTVDSFTLQNCAIEANTNSGGSIGIGVNATNAAFSALDATVNARGHVYINNDIKVRHRGIAPLYTRGIQVIGNRIEVTNTGVGATSSAVGDLLNNADTANPGTYIIRDNVITKAETRNATANQGIAPLSLSGGSGVHYIVQNNIITGFNFTTTAAAADQIASAIRATSTSDRYTIEHNSINLVVNDKVTAATAANVGGINLPASTNPALNVVRNNIVRVSYATTAAAPNAVAFRAAAAIPAANITGNTLFNASATNTNLSIIDVNTYANIGAHQTAGFDTVASGGGSVDPFTLSTPWTDGLKFLTNTLPTGLLAVTGTYATDVDGETRSLAASSATPGADEPNYVAPASSGASWNLYH